MRRRLSRNQSGLIWGSARFQKVTKCANEKVAKEKMSSEMNIELIDGGSKLELDEETSSLQTESEDLNSPQVETNTENELSTRVIHVPYFD